MAWADKYRLYQNNNTSCHRSVYGTGKYEVGALLEDTKALAKSACSKSSSPIYDRYCPGTQQTCTYPFLIPYELWTLLVEIRDLFVYDIARPITQVIKVD